MKKISAKLGSKVVAAVYDRRIAFFLGHSTLTERRYRASAEISKWVASSEVRIFHAALGVILQADEQMAPRRVAEMAMVAAAFPAAVTEFQQHIAVGLRCEDEFLRGADPIRRGAAGAFPAHERWRRQLLDAHLKNGRQLKETEDRHAAGLGVHPHGGGPPRADAVLGGDGLINRYRRRSNADEMDEVGGHKLFNH